MDGAVILGADCSAASFASRSARRASSKSSSSARVGDFLVATAALGGFETASTASVDVSTSSSSEVGASLSWRVYATPLACRFFCHSSVVILAEADFVATDPFNTGDIDGLVKLCI